MSTDDLQLAYVCMPGLNLLQVESVAQMEDLIHTTGAGFVAIDALADVMLGGDENNVQDTQRVFHHLRMVAEKTGAAIVVIHHTNKAGGYRGSSAIKGAVDLMLMVDSEPDSPNINIRSVKSRDTEPFLLAATAQFDDETTVIKASGVAAKAGKLGKGETYVLDYLT